MLKIGDVITIKEFGKEKLNPRTRQPQKFIVTGFDDKGGILLDRVKDKK